jgi:hypothetical protein
MHQIACRTKSKDSNASSQWLKGERISGVAPKGLIVNFESRAAACPFLLVLSEGLRSFCHNMFQFLLESSSSWPDVDLSR